MNVRVWLAFLFSGCVLLSASATAQLVEVPLQDRVKNSTLIVEGRVVDQFSFWNPQRTLIYTSNLVTLFKVFRGSVTHTEIEVITEGGTVDDFAQHLTETLSLSVGQTGMFFLEATAVQTSGRAVNSGVRAQVYASMQGFVQYEQDGSAADPFAQYPSYATDLYERIIRITGEQYRVIAPLLWLNGSTGRVKGGGAIQAVPTFTSITPSSRSGGSDSSITIAGTNFNSPRGTGKVSFKNADDGGATWISPLNPQYISWSGTSISLEVPSNAGTGTIRVINSTPDTATSAATLTVPYAVLNATFYGTPRPTRFVDINGMGGMTWRMYTGFNSNAAARASFLRAMTSWRCGATYGSGVHWDLGPTTSIDAAAYDGVNVIRFDVGSELPTGVLGRCSSYWSLATCGGTDSTTYVTELDIVFDSGTSWNYSTGAPGGSQYDFESVAVHELGHGHQLAHVINASAIMNYSIASGTSKRTLSNLDTAAANSVLRRSFAASTCGPSAMAAVHVFAGNNTTLCSGSSVDLRAYGGLTYLWNTASTDTLPTLTVSPTTTTSYIVSVTNGACYSASDTVVVTVTTPPSASAGSDAAICVGDSVAIGTTSTDSVSTLGTVVGSLTNFPFRTSVQDQRTQMLYWNNELLTAGLRKGYITAIAIKVVDTTGTKPMADLSVSMMNTTDSSLSTGFRSSLTSVLSLASYRPQPRWDTLYFSTPFAWDGASNLIVETCFDNTSTSTNGYAVDCSLMTGYRTTYYNGTGGCGVAATNISPYRPLIKFIWQPKKYEWSPTAGLSRAIRSKPTASPSATTTYTLTVSDSNGCSGSDAAVVTVYPTNPTTLTWTGGVNTDWSTVGNWNAPCAIPTTGDTVIVPTATTPPASVPAMTLGGMSIDNASGTTLGGAVSLSGVLTLTTGKISLGTNNLSIASTGSISGGSASSFVVTNSTGELRQAGIGTGGRTGAIAFPVGDSTTRYSPASITNTGTSDEFRVRVSGAVLSGGTSGSPLTTHAVGKTWHVSEATGGGSTVALTLQWNGINELASFTRTSSAVASHNGSVWAAVSSYGAAGGSNPYTRSASGLSAFGPFAVGDGSSPLPVELAAFTARVENGTVVLRWKTLSELNSARFVIERREADAGAWIDVGQVPARGNSDILLDYSYSDTPSRAGGVLHYRLRTVDRDGSFRHSDMRTVSFRAPESIALFASYPNPFGTAAQPGSASTDISFALPKDSFASLRVYDANGKMVRVLVAEILSAGAHARRFEAADLPSGVYRAVLSVGTEVRIGTVVLAR
ncbi:MAG: matrixin family metalloprotease [Ignavibacteria bacterium]|nr:matrixin family metalloprotease [Ignavibacteria bacterium]